MSRTPNASALIKSGWQAIAFGIALLCLGTSHAQLPSGGTVTGGSASINQSGQNQVINQTTSRAIIDWQNFSIGAGNSVRFNQPNSSSIMLNRVVGNNPSNILGSMSANGQIFLVNPFGVYFGAGATVDVAGLIATTMNIRNDDFMAGNYVFNRSSSSAARSEVINAGVLKAREGGYVVLAGDYAANNGVIEARLGTAALASGSKMTLDIKGDQLINFAVNEKTVAQLSGVENTGQILADGGKAIMTASVARELSTTAVNNTGLIQAQGTVERDGAIYLSGDGGNVQVSGKLDVSGTAQGQKGGTIEVLGDKVALVNAATLDASGNAGGGTIRIGGAFQGQGPQPNAQTAYVGKDVQIKADALANGNGGNVVVWSDKNTRFYGNISAQGGAQGGDGGNVEVSGKAYLDFNGQVKTLAPKGKAGNLLLDPSDIEILNTIGATPDMTASSPFADATNNGGTSQMTVATLENALANGNVTVTTTTASGTAPKGGTITIDDGGGGGVQWSTANTLRLQATNQILIKSTVEGYNGTLWLDAGNGAVQSPGTIIGANSLLLTGSGFFDLVGVTPSNFVGSWNNVGTLAANLSNGSTLRYSANQNLAIGTVNGVSGVNVGSGGSAQFYHDRGNSLTLAQGVTAGSMFFRGSGAVNQTGGTLQVSTLGITGNTSSVNLTAANNIGTIGISANGPVNINNSGPLTVGTGTFGVAGITTNNNNVTITTGDATGYDKTKLPDGTNPASLTINESINAGTGTVKLTTGSGGAYQRHDVNSSTSQPLPNGSITAGNLLLQSSSGSKVTPFILTNANNLVGTLAANVNGSVSYVGGPLTVGSVGGVNGISTTSNTIVTPAGTDSSGRATPDIYNDNNISLSVGGNLNINQNINAATTTGSGSVSIGVGGDYTASTASGVRIDANTLGVFGDDKQGTFLLTTKASSLAAAGGKLMVIDNSAYAGDLTALGIGAPATSTSATNGSNTVTVNSTAKPVGDFYLTTGGGLNIIKLISQGDNLMLRANSLNILLDAATKDGARIMLLPYNLSNKIGINNSIDSDFTADTNYSATTLLKFTNPTATFFFGTPQNVILNDAAVPNAAKLTQTGDIHIGSDGAFNLGYRSISAQTSGSIVAHNVGPLYNLRLAAPNLTINSFNTFGDQIHFFSNNLVLPGTTADYVNPNKPTITLRPLNDETVWIGLAPSSKSRPDETQILSQYIVKLPDSSTIVISGSTDYPFPSGGPGYGDIHIPWNDTLGATLGNRNLILSTGSKLYTYGPTPNYTKQTNGGTSGGLWKGCQDLTTCKGTNPSPYPDPSPVDTGTNNGTNSGTGSDPTKPDTSGCKDCPPAPPNTNPYPPDVTPVTDNPDPTGCKDVGGCGGKGTDDDGGGGDCKSTDGCGGDGGGDSGGGCSDAKACDGNDGPGDDKGGGGECTSADGCGGDGGGDSGSGCSDPTACGGNDGPGDDKGGGDGDCKAADGCGGDGGGDSGSGCSDATSCTGDGKGTGDGGGDNDNPGDNPGTGTGTGTGGTGDGDGNGDDGAGSGSGGTGDGDGTGGTGSGSGGDTDTGDGTGGSGTGGQGDGSGDGGAGSGSGGTGDGDGNGATNGSGNGTGTDADINGDGTGGTGTGGTGDGDGSGDGGAGSGSGGTGDGDGTGGAGSGSGNGTGTGDGIGGAGTGGLDDGNGDGGAGVDSGGTGDGSGSGAQNGSGNGTGTGTGAGSGGDGNSDGGGDAGSATNSGGTSDNQSSSNSNDRSGDRSDSMAAPAFHISCDNVTTNKNRKQDNSAGKQGLIEVNRDGVKLPDPCSEQTEQDEAK